MSRLPALLLSLLWLPLAHAVEEAEQPAEMASPTVIAIFVLTLIACVVIYVWLTWKNEKKSEQEKLGDKF